MSRMIKGFSLVCITILLFSLFQTDVVFVHAEDEEVEQVEQLSGTDEPTETTSTEALVADMKLIANTDTLELYFEETTAAFAVKDKRDNHIWYSNPADREQDQIAQGENKGLLHAQLSLTYFNPTGHITKLDSYKDSVAKEQVEFVAVDNGIKVIYTFGNESKGIEQLPGRISKERFESLILNKIDDEKAKKDFAKRYKLIEEEDLYERRDASFPAVILNRTVALLQEIGYTEEDLAADYAEHFGESEDVEQSYPFFIVPMLIQLEPDGLSVKIIGEEIEYNEVYPLNKLHVLPFFGAANQDQSGYMLVPDGSGALIELNNGKSNYQPYSARVYGKDEAVFTRTDLLTSEDIKLPVFGMKQGDHAFLTVIEEGDGLASIEADVSERLNSYNSVYSSFTIKDAGEVTLAGGERSNTVYIFQKGRFQEDISLKYLFLSGEASSYVGMAQTYQQYLQENVGLTQLKPVADLPFYLELTGSVWKRKTILGVPYKALEPLTTFEEAEEIVDAFLDQGIEYVNVRFTGWFNEGVNHKIPKNIKVDKAIGGSKGFNTLKDNLANKQVGFYPDVAFSTVYRNTIGFSPTKDASRFVNRKVAEVYPINPATYRRDLVNRTSYHLLSPQKLASYVDGFEKDYTQFNLASLAIRDLGAGLHSDFREKKVVNREQTKQIVTKQLDKLVASQPDLMLIGGNGYALPYAQSILEAPLSSSGFNIADRSIPFYQMVIHGYVDYAGQPVNLSSYQSVNSQMLKALELGSNVYFSLFYEDPATIKETESNHLYSAHYRHWLDEAVEMYKEVNAVLKSVRTEPITNHRELVPGVFETTYGKDYHVIVNYNQKAVTVEGQQVAAESYTLREGE